MAATGLQLDWTSVSFASAALTRVTSVMFGQGGELIEFMGDNNRYPVVIANNVNRPHASVTSGDVASLMAIAPGSVGALVASQADALAQTGGAVNWTLSNAVHQNTDDTGRWGAFAEATATFRAYSTDGSTNPLAFTRT